MELVDRLILAVVSPDDERVVCESGDAFKEPGVPDGLVLMKRIRAMRA